MTYLQQIGSIAILVCSLTLTAVPQGEHSFRPDKGFVPDKVTAMRIAEAVLTQIYGRQKIESERPFSAQLTGNTWKIEGSMPSGTDGGVAEIWIDKRDGRILRVTHGK